MATEVAALVRAQNLPLGPTSSGSEGEQAGGLGLELYDPTAGGRRVVEPSNWGFSQLAQYAKAPAAYLRTLPAELAAIHTVLLTHAHLDHVCGLAFMAAMAWPWGVICRMLLRGAPGAGAGGWPGAPGGGPP